jgi:hypothetical protein
MIVAEVAVTIGTFVAATHHVVRFDTLAAAEAEYERLAAIVKRKQELANNVPAIIEIQGSGCDKITFALADMRVLSLVDFVKANAELAGVKEAFPNLFK